MKKLALAIGLILIGALITLVGLYAWLESRIRPTMTEEQIRQKYVQDYTRNEQVKHGIDCHELKAQLRGFLDLKVGSIIDARESGKDWDALVSDELKRELARHKEFLFICLRLYEVGDAGRRNGLADLGFTPEVHREMIVMDILLRLGGPSQNCDAHCLDGKFRELQTSYNQVLKRLS